MSGTVAGGKKAAATNKAKYGKDFYAKIGAMGGKVGHTGGFFADRKLASEAGRKGGLVSRRRPSVVKAHAEFQEGFNQPTWKDKVMARIK